MSKTVTFKPICKDCGGSQGVCFEDDWCPCPKCRGTGFFGRAIINAKDIEKIAIQYLKSRWVFTNEFGNSDSYIHLIDQFLQYLPKRKATKLLNEFVPEALIVLFRKHDERCSRNKWFKWF